MDADTARALVAQGEGQRIEFKRSFAEENGAIISLCAFTHSDGGTVLFGVSDEGEVIGVTLGRNTLENFANRLRADTQPPLTPSIETVSLDGKTVVAVTIRKAGPGELFYACSRPYVRVGKASQVMAPEQQRARFQAVGDPWAEERDRPRFEAEQAGVTELETRFQPIWKIRQDAGDYVPDLEWRFRGPRFPMDWQPARGAALERMTISATFDLTRSATDDNLVGPNELGLEIRSHWRGKWRHELHRWPILRRELPTKVLWEVGREIIPPVYFDRNTRDVQ